MRALPVWLLRPSRALLLETARSKHLAATIASPARDDAAHLDGPTIERRRREATHGQDPLRGGWRDRTGTVHRGADRFRPGPAGVVAEPGHEVLRAARA